MDSFTTTNRRQRPYLWLCAAAVSVAAALVLYSQTWAFAWDEGFHLLAAQLIKAGRKPYLDFVFSQTPLNAYWNAAWMWIFGESWRTAHAVAALLSAAAVFLAADFLFTRFPVAHWRLAAGLTAATMTGLNVAVFEYGTVAQAYGICLFLTVAAYRAAILAPDQDGWVLSAVAGLLASGAAGSSLLTATTVPVILAWLWIYNRNGGRWIKSIAFIAGAMLPFLPVLWLFMQSPKAVWFGIFEYNGIYRTVDWPGTTRHNLEVFSYWIDSSQALTLGLLAALGAFFVHKSEWPRARRAEFYLCGWIALATGAWLCTPRPTFQRYFLLTVPFLAILAAAGLYWLTVRMWDAARPSRPVMGLALLVILGLTKSLYERREVYTWPFLEGMARKVNEVTRPGGTLMADEQIYFITRRRPPPGFELDDSHKLELLPADLARRLHVVSKSEVKRLVVSGFFETVATCEDDDEVLASWGLTQRYSHKAAFDDCAVYWDRAPATKQVEKPVTTSGPVVK